jgi:hypothetical protein
MGMQGWMELLVGAQVDGPTLTAAAAASCIPPAAKYTLKANYFDYIGKQLLIKAYGRISVVVTTPGTARYDVRFGATVVADSLAMPLNIVAKTSVNWELEMLATCRLLGTAGNLMWQGRWISEAVIGSPLPTVGGSGVFTLPFNSAPAVGANFDTTASQAVDMFFTQTVATGSMTLHQYAIYGVN